MLKSTRFLNLRRTILQYVTKYRKLRKEWRNLKSTFANITQSQNYIGSQNNNFIRTTYFKIPIVLKVEIPPFLQ